MTRPSAQHLTPDEIDRLLEGPSDPSLTQHLDGCTTCASTLREQGMVVRTLESLPVFAPSDDFADQVMFQVAVPDPFAIRSLASTRERVLHSSRARAWVLSAAALLLATMGASIVWTALNRETLASAGDWLGGQATQWFWVAIRGAFANITEQPWFGPMRQALGAPARLALLSACAMLLYAGGVLALRKLMTFPSQGAAHARA
jgi:hypothetical protein